MKVYFFPGVGADESLAPYHELPGHDSQWIRWPAEPGRNWNDFDAALLAENEIEAGAVFIGISFGGMAAQAVATRARDLKSRYFPSTGARIGSSPPEGNRTTRYSRMEAISSP